MEMHIYIGNKQHPDVAATVQGFFGVNSGHEIPAKNLNNMILKEVFDDSIGRKIMVFSFNEKLSDRREILISHLKNIGHYTNDTQVLEDDEPNYFIVESSKVSMRYKVYTKKECIKEWAHIYAGNGLDSITLSSEVISGILGIPENLLEPLDLLIDINNGKGTSTEHLADILDRTGKMKELAATMESENFYDLATDDNAAKHMDYYILEWS